MQYLQQLIGAGFNRGHGNAPGMDRTVGSLEWALSNLGNSGTARCYAADAAGSLEARLVACYIIQSIAYFNSGDIDAAVRECKRARGLQQLASDQDSFGGAMAAQVDAALAELEGMFESKKLMAA